MKKLLLILLTLISLNNYSQSTCASPTTISSGGCLNNISFPGSVNMAGLCVGGSNPSIFIRFTAGSCSQFNITPNFTLGTSSDLGYQILTNGCSSISGGLGCIGNVVAGEQFSISGIGSTGTNLLTSGTQYILQIWGAVGAGTMNICYNASTAGRAANECGGALGLGTSTQSFYNGGDCSYSGSYDDATTTDEPANEICAGSLENTQWVKFTAAVGATSISISGTNISCTGGGCGFQFGIQSGSCGSLTNQGCYGNKVCSGGQPSAGPTDVSGGYTMTWSGLSSSGFTLDISGLSGLGGEEFYLIMDGNADADCNYDLIGTNIVPMPVTLLNFNINKINNKIEIKWNTSSEINNDYFIIEKMTNNGLFYPITKIKGKGNSSTLVSYNYNDFDLIEGDNYYRIKQFDFDGKVEILSTKYIKIKKDDLEIESIHNVRGNYLGNNIDEVEKNIVLIIKHKNGTYTKTIKF